MKKTLFMMMAMIMALTMQAQPQPGNRPHRPMDPEKVVAARVDRLDKELQLTAEQKTAITKIYTQEMAQMKENMKQQPSQGADREQARQKMKAHYDEVNAQVASVLNADQKAKFEQIKNEEFRHHGRHGARHRGMRSMGNGKDCCAGADKKDCDKKDCDKKDCDKKDCDKKDCDKKDCDKKDCDKKDCDKKGCDKKGCDKKDCCKKDCCKKGCDKKDCCKKDCCKKDCDKKDCCKKDCCK